MVIVCVTQVGIIINKTLIYACAVTIAVIVYVQCVGACVFICVHVSVAETV